MRLRAPERPRLRGHLRQPDGRHGAARACSSTGRAARCCARGRAGPGPRGAHGVQVGDDGPTGRLILLDKSPPRVVRLDRRTGAQKATRLPRRRDPQLRGLGAGRLAVRDRLRGRRRSGASRRAAASRRGVARGPAARRRPVRHSPASRCAADRKTLARRPAERRPGSAPATRRPGASSRSRSARRQAGPDDAAVGERPARRARTASPSPGRARSTSRCCWPTRSPWSAPTARSRSASRSSR